MQVLHERLADDPNVQLVSVHVDERQDPPKYLKDNKYTYKSIPMTSELQERFNIRSIPAYYVLDRNGAVLHSASGILTDEKRDELERIAMEASR